MKRILSVAVLTIFLFSVGSAKKTKTVSIKDNVATDLKYGWKLTVPENWKAKGSKEPSVERLYMEKKNYQVNPYIRQYGGDYTIPHVIVFEAPFNGTVDDFENLLKKSLEEHRSDNEIINKMGLLLDSDFIVSADVKLDSATARQIYIKRNYKRLLYVPERGGGLDQGQEQYINDHEVHEIYLLKTGDNILVFQAYSEREFYDTNSIEFQKIIKSLVL